MSTLLSKLVWIILPCGLVAAGGGYWWNARQTSDEGPSYRSARPEFGSVILPWGPLAAGQSTAIFAGVAADIR